MENFNRVLGKHVAKWRRNAGMSQSTLAVALNTQQATVSKLENGSYRISVSQLSEILDACGLTFSDIAPDLDAINPSEPQPLWRRIDE